jgi:hypothetical protein
MNQLTGIPFAKAKDAAPELKAAFDAFDNSPKGKNDPSRCKALLKFPDGTIFWSSKMAIDADGPAAGPGRLSGSQLDLDSGQDETSFSFPGLDNGLPSETVPYIVLPGGSFRKATGLAMGDVAAVIYQDKLTAALCGDIGPKNKIGEGSIRLHEVFNPQVPDPCAVRDGNHYCKRIHNVSIDEDVLFFAFPDSAINDLKPETLEMQVKLKAYGLMAKLRQSVV